jgi:alkaline phosphatase
MVQAGFVLLVESGRIDMGHHQNQARHAMEETLSLETTVEAALSMVNIRETLVIVTADHSHAVTIRFKG